MEDMQPNIDPKETDEIIKKLEHIPIEDIGCPALVFYIYLIIF